MENHAWRKERIGWIIAINALIVVIVAVVIAYYIGDYRTKLYNRNLADLINQTQSSANAASVYADYQQRKLIDLSNYIEKHNFDYDEAVDYLGDFVEDGDSIQLVGTDFNGITISEKKGNRQAVSYASSDYRELQKILDDTNKGEAGFCVEFTDAVTTIRSFAFYIHFPLKNQKGETNYYTMISLMDSERFLNQINVNDTFEDMSTVLINKDGDYVISDSSFKSNNFYKFLYVYNNLSLDKENSVKAEVWKNQVGNLRYNNNRGVTCEYAYAKLPDSDWYSVSCVPIRSFETSTIDINCTLVVGFLLLILMIVDFSWFYEMNQDLKESIRLERDSSAAKTDFLSRMSHDIRTPLNGIIGMTILAKDENNIPQIRKYLGEIDTSSQYLLGLVNDILDMDKIQKGKIELRPEPYTLQEFNHYMNTLIRPLCEDKQIEFRFDTNHEPLTIMVDKMRFNQIIVNLLSNAVKYTNSGGYVHLYASRFEVEDNRLHLEVVVEDNGIGMSKSFQKHMFEAFSQENTSAAINGSGLGLSIVKQLTELMGGTVSVESELGKGSKFTLALQLEIYQGEVDNSIPKDKPMDGSLAGRNVLLCEDHPLNQVIACKLLEKKGVKVTTADNGEMGVELFAQSGEGFYDAVLMDIRMPVLDGLSATARIRELPREDGKKIPIIAMTANAFEEDMKQSKDAGMSGYITKPIAPNLLYDTLYGEIHRYRSK